MPRTRLISSVKLCQKVVRNILLLPTDTIAMSMKVGRVYQTACIVLVCIATPKKDVFIFDTKICPEQIHEGELWRIIQSDTLTKIMYDCRICNGVLLKQFYITLRNVYDLQAAYNVIMVQNGLPPRIATLEVLYEKYGGNEKPFLQLKDSVEGNLMYWNKRPVSLDMIRLAKDSTLSLMGQVYLNINKDISTDTVRWVKDLSHAYITGTFPQASPLREKNLTAIKPSQIKRSKSTSLSCDQQAATLLASVQGQRAEDNNKILNSHQLILKLTDKHQRLLSGSLSQANYMNQTL